MAGYSSWVAGNSVLPQEPHQFSRSWVDGSSATFQIKEGAQDSWFQFSIPTPTRVAGKVGRLERFMLLFRNEGSPDAAIARVDLWDGPLRIGKSYAVNWGGDHSQSIEQVAEAGGSWGGNIVPVNDHQMNWGLNVSLQVLPGNGGPVTFISAGADFWADT